MTFPARPRDPPTPASSRHALDGAAKLADRDPDGAVTISVEGMAAFGLGVVRAGTLLLGGGHLLNGTPSNNAVIAFAAVATTSVAVYGRAGFRVRRRSSLPPLDGAAALAETVAGLTGLLLLRGATLTDALSWMLPYTVVTTVLLAATCRRVTVGLAGVLSLTFGYLIAVSPALHLASSDGRALAAPALADALSYPLFFALGTIIFHQYRFITGEVALLRRQAAQNSAERARLQAARAAYRLGHDYPKAYLRELRRAEMSPAELRQAASQFRDDLLTALHADPRVEVDLDEEITNLAATFAGVMSIRVDTRALTDELHGVPVLVIAEAVRECLNNASYHAYGSAVTVAAASSDGLLSVTVHDDGPGCNADQVMAAWALKQNAVYLVEAAGGGYTVESTPAAGTTVRVTYPLPAGTERRS